MSTNGHQKKSNGNGNGKPNGNKKRNGNGNGNGKKPQSKKDSLRDIGLATTVALGMLLAPLPTLVVVGSAYLGAKRQEKKQKKNGGARAK